MKASGVNGKTKERFTQRPALFDSKKRPITNGTVIWGGSQMKVAYQLAPYYVPAIGAGVSARLKAVQILKLVEGKDMLRFIQNDYPIACNIIDDVTYPVDVPEDI